MSSTQLSFEQEYNAEIDELEETVYKSHKKQNERNIIMNEILSSDDVRKNKRVIRMKNKQANKINRPRNKSNGIFSS